jgi:DNA topoisomerase-1
VTTRKTPSETARLRHSTDSKPGISRRRAGRGFSYRDPDGRRITGRETLDRIRKLAIPPAWTDVWICPDPLGHLQATGRDAKGRKQYRYHTRFRERRETHKYERLVAFARALPAIRRQVDRDLARPGLPREKVLAAVVRLLELTLIRVGNDEYRRLNRSFGLTTLHDRHATVSGTSIRFRFRGKSGRAHEVGLRDRRLATVIQRCQDLPGQELFQYEGEDGEPVNIASDDVNEYLQSIAPEVTAKDFRTWAGTVLAYRALRALDEPETASEAKKNVVAAIRDTADQLGNTAAVCRRSYVHPVVVESYLDPRLRGALLGAAEATGAPPAGPTPREERAVVRLLERRLGRDAARVSAGSRTRSSGRG